MRADDLPALLLRELAAERKWRSVAELAAVLGKRSQRYVPCAMVRSLLRDWCARGVVQRAKRGQTPNFRMRAR